MFHSSVILLFLCVLSMSCSKTTISGIPISRVDYSFNAGQASSPINVELNIDLGCSATKDSWETLSAVVHKYSDSVKFNIRIMPLPYHQQSFLLSKAATTVYYYNGDRSAFNFMNTVISNQAEIYNSATADMTQHQVEKLIMKWAVNGTGLTETEFIEGFDRNTESGNTIEMFTRYEWKYAAMHGFYGTPMYKINGLFIELDSLEDWEKVLNPLVNPTQRKIDQDPAKIYAESNTIYL